MKKSFLLLLIFLSACSSSDNSGMGNKSDKKTARHLPPSEAMQAGFSKKAVIDFNDSDDEGSDGEMVDYNKKYSLPSADDYEGTYKVGDPYKIFGVSYVPQSYENYEEVGSASWYGDDFHGKPTANGETYNSAEMTAAHRTLPLPSLVRVTNLKNGKSAIVRVNDRGPFAKDRVIDVSERAAINLGFRDTGTTDVKVELMKNDTDEMLARLKIKN
jgi:rare lipoprotein A (peptidoglycan hydrolase)